MIKVILLIDCASEFDRKLLRGVMRYSRENGSWLFHRMPSDFRLGGKEREDWVVNWARQWNADAIIGRWNESNVDVLSRLNIPVVLQNNSSRSDIYSNLTGDYIGTGRLAAGYFHKKLFTDYAFFGVKNIIWSEERCFGFQDEVAKFKGRFYSYKEEPGESLERDSVIEWLRSLPKPAALFCCDDAHALYITECCNMSGIGIPEDLALLGVDNDELLCGISDPPISSIALDVEQGGWQMCRLLHRRLEDRDSSPFNVIINPVSVVERQSTLFYNIRDPYVEKVVRHIDENYSSQLDMPSLLDLVPLSRRSIEMRFKKTMETTVYQYLISTRVSHLAHLLATTDKDITQLAYLSGFGDSSNVSRIFKKVKGCTPLEYRQKYCVI